GTYEDVRATCSRCGHETESGGTGENSIKRCLVLMRGECPQGENNRYEDAAAAAESATRYAETFPRRSSSQRRLAGGQTSSVGELSDSARCFGTGREIGAESGHRSPITAVP